MNLLESIAKAAEEIGFFKKPELNNRIKLEDFKNNLDKTYECENNKKIVPNSCAVEDKGECFAPLRRMNAMNLNLSEEIRGGSIEECERIQKFSAQTRRKNKTASEVRMSSKPLNLNHQKTQQEESIVKKIMRDAQMQ